MVSAFLAIIPVFIVLVFSEYLWKTKRIRGEAARKLVHIVVGSYVAFWPWFLSNRQIIYISAVFFLTVLATQYLKLFHAISGKGHRRVGELLFAVGIGVTAFLTNDRWIFMIAILHLSVADGLAGLIGSKWGRSTKYKVCDQQKSVLGSLVFYASSLLILSLATANYPGLDGARFALLLLLPIALTATENIGIWSTDNVLVPLLVVAVLTTVQL